MTLPTDRSAHAAGQNGQERADALAELLAHVLRRDDEEKRLLARQLHDKLGASLTALSMHLSLLARHMPDDQALQERTALVKQLLVNVIEGNRALQATLWNDTFEFLGVKAALHELASNFGQHHGVTVRASLPEQDLDCPREHGLLLLRAAQEGLGNCAAHAGATEVDLVLDENDEGWMLTVRDNGKGIDGALAEASRHGLRLLRERARPLQGSIALQSNPAGAAGASLTVHLPKA